MSVDCESADNVEVQDKKSDASKNGNRQPASYIIPSIQKQIEKKENPDEKPKEVTPAPIQSAEEPSPEEDYGLTGSWGGYRKTLSDLGIDFSVIYKSDWTRNTRGGISTKTAYLDNLDLKMNLDMDKMAGLKGLSLFAYGIRNSGANRGDRPSQFVGDWQWTSNIETYVDDFRLYQAFIQQLFFEDRASVLFGLHDLNSEFYVTNTATLFLHSSFGLGLDLSQAGPNGPSVFPYTAPALRIKVEPSKNLYMQTAVFEAQAGSSQIAKGTHFKINSADGRLQISEFGFTGTEENPYKYSIGYWSFSRTFDHIENTITDSDGNTFPQKAGSSGAYVSMDHSLTKNFSAFLTYGFATTESNYIKDDLTLGFSVTGLIPKRNKDRLGFGLSRITPGKEYLHTQSITSHETAYELTYRVEVSPGVVVQPDLQYIIHPGLNPSLQDAFITTLRLELSL